MARGSGGGFVGANVNDATITYNPTTTAYLNASFVDSDGDVSVTAEAETSATASTVNGTGGFVGIGDADTGG